MTKTATFEPLGVTTAITAQILGCSKPTVYRMVERGELDFYMVGSDKRITTESIKRKARVKTLKPREAAEAEQAA